MSLSDDLLKQAVHLATLEPKRPKQASLRRAVSTAYYGLFHLVIEEASRRLVAIPRFRPSVARAFNHQQLAKAAKAVHIVHANPKNDHWFKAHLVVPVSTPLDEFCSTFVDLQDRRHEADYDTAATFTRGDVRSLLNLAQDARVKWRGERDSENALAFLLLGAGLLRER